MSTAAEFLDELSDFIARVTAERKKWIQILRDTGVEKRRDLEALEVQKAKILKRHGDQQEMVKTNLDQLAPVLEKAHELVQTLSDDTFIDLPVD